MGKNTSGVKSAIDVTKHGKVTASGFLIPAHMWAVPRLSRWALVVLTRSFTGNAQAT